jgi:methyltransferase family protein
VTELEQRIDALDPTLFDDIPSQTSVWDRFALLSVHAAMATVLGRFNYLEIGSFHGGSLQVVMRDPRCTKVISIDPRPTHPPDKRSESWPVDRRSGSWMYEDNTTDTMLGFLRTLPAVDMDKLTTFEIGTDRLLTAELPLKPHYCFIDGEHTDEAALRDARFCFEAIGGPGVIAFHDSLLVKPAIDEFVKETWQDVSYALNFGGGVFAIEFGGPQILTQPVVRRAIGSKWHSVLWQAANRHRRSSLPFRVAWNVIPALDLTVLRARKALGQHTADKSR